MDNQLVVIGGSAGSFKIVNAILSGINSGCPASSVFCLHRARNIRYGFVEALAKNRSIRITEPSDKDPILPGHCYIAPSNYHLLIEQDQSFSLSTFKLVNHSRPSIDLTFKTAAYVYREKLTAVLLSGANSDGAEGLRTVHDYGGRTIVQDPDDAEIQTMPASALKLFNPDHIWNAQKIITFIQEIK